MDALEIAEFLETQQTGVLSLAKNDNSYGIPVSFAFDEAEHNVYLRLGYGASSTKREFVESVDRASFVVYARSGDTWKSVLARGRLEEIAENRADTAAHQAVNNLKIPYFRVFEEPADDIELTIVRIDVTELTGIIAGE